MILYFNTFIIKISLITNDSDVGGYWVLLLINSFFSNKKEATKKGKNSEYGFMLLEVVIVIIITVMLMTTLYQFFGFMNKKSRSQITDQVLSDSINNFFQAISKDFRTAQYVTFNNSNEIYIVNQMDQPITYTFLAESVVKLLRFLNCPSPLPASPHFVMKLPLLSNLYIL